MCSYILSEYKIISLGVVWKCVSVHNIMNDQNEYPHYVGKNCITPELLLSSALIFPQMLQRRRLSGKLWFRVFLVLLVLLLLLFGSC